MKRKRFLSLTAVVLTAVLFSACGAEVDDNGTSDNDIIIESTDTQVENINERLGKDEIKTIEPPEDGWTLDELLNVTYIYGKKIDLPCALGDILDGDFSLGEGNPLFETSDTKTVMLNYNNEPIASMLLSVDGNDGNNSISNQSIVDSIFLANFINENNKENVFINGVSLSDNYDVIKEKLGEPDIKKTKSVYYCDKNENENIILGFGLDSEGNILGVDFESE